MSRPLRIEFASALYHVTSRGDGREAIFLDEQDRRLFLGVMSEVVQDCNREEPTEAVGTSAEPDFPGFRSLRGKLTA